MCVCVCVRLHFCIVLKLKLYNFARNNFEMRQILTPFCLLSILPGNTTPFKN